MPNGIQTTTFSLVEDRRHSTDSLVLRHLQFATDTIEKMSISVNKFIGNSFSLSWTNPETKKREYVVSLPDIQRIVSDLIKQNQIPSKPIEDLGLL